ncbi:GntR family transcriptional regulator [Sulfitobacter sp. PR48]|jgi:DNA-binding GntR family transcriptional regulator|uniref:GntR family transcriptional regulator n=1 Tax=unclassified Sulfitobacter TaxID=196795 RepID=UPI0022AFA182|nr:MULTISPECIES: GntR family transcriptional regulator [unclassified Sulfitobacter]MCZ4254211.1 GntR family transcriptional regulator [Sulfitobacter sp. G21635-S1]MDD9722001.1 GntR family transcriptional regulator [Sulfitobacter sp. PR48]GLT11197.1 GntR family transcriptional regulator [Sulfitobacter porphyrae]
MAKSTVIARTAAPLRQQVVRLVREDILEGKLVPGQRLVESTLCDAYGVSRTVIREALRQLESEHLIEVVPNLGPIVAVLTEKEIRSIYVVRAALEGLAGKLFAENADATQAKNLVKLRDRLDREYRKGDIESRELIKADFYRQLTEGGGNEILAESLRSMHARIAMFRRFAFVDEARIEPSIAELETIIDAAAIARNGEAAWAACEHHILLAGELAIEEYVKRNKDILPDG